MRRSKPLQGSIEAHRAWQQRSQQAAIARSRQPNSTATRRRNQDLRRDAEWRDEVYELRGRLCRVMGCGRMADEVDHLIPRRPSTRWALPNGWPMCREHHRLKTAHQLLIDPSWLDPDQIEWLRDAGHAAWGDDGEVTGAHRTLFATKEGTT